MTYNFPFHISTYYDSQYQPFSAEGVLNFDGDSIELEYRIRSVMDRSESEVQHVQLDLKQIRSVNYKSSIFGQKIQIELKSLKMLAGIPFSNHDRITLSVRSFAKQNARAMASIAALRISEIRIEELDKD
jgi:hypothetical protein